MLTVVLQMFFSHFVQPLNSLLLPIYSMCLPMSLRRLLVFPAPKTEYLQ